LFQISFKVRIPHSKIASLKKSLRDDPSLQAKVAVPPKAKRNPSGIAEIRVTAQTQGSDHAKLIEEAIKFNDGSIAGRLDYGKDSLGVRICAVLKKIWLPSVLSYTAIVGSVATFHPVMPNEYGIFIIFATAIAIPASMAIGTAHLLTK